MEVNKNDFDFLKELIRKCNENASYELECAIKDTFYKNDIDRLINYLRRTSRFDEHDSSVQLDLIFDNYRVTIDNKDNIREYCKTDKLQKYSIMKKTLVKNSKLSMNQYNLLFRLKNELEIGVTEFESYIIDDADKVFRYKDRRSYIDKENGLFRIDITCVKQSDGKAKTLTKSGCLKTTEMYEIEIEFLNEKNHGLTDKLICEEFLKTVFEIFEVLSNVESIMDNDKRNKVFIEYIKLVSPAYYEKMSSRLQDMFRSITKTPKRFFLSYQPITLENKNMIEDNLNYTSILNDYTVTEKTDGERYLIYVDEGGESYSFNNRMLVEKLNIKNEYRNSLLDVEFVKKSKYGTNINEFMVFDIYFMNGEDTRNQKLVPDRIDTMKRCVKGFKGKSKFNIICKTFQHGKSIYEMNKKVYDKEKYKYNIDGLIYTPANLAVGAIYNNEEHKKNTFGGTWNQLFKWKPAEENSIDMLVSFVRQENVINIGKCMLCDLKVSVNVNSEKKIEPYKILSNTTSLMKTYRGEYEPKVFGSVYLLINENDKYPKTQTNDVIYDNCIVEFVYNQTEQLYFKWKPYRVRYDKTELYKKTNNIANTANNLVVAENVQRSIENPLTYDHLIGKITIDKTTIVDEKYYSRKTSRENLLSKSMALFHNIGVKGYLYNLFKNKNFTLVDLACGKGGDISKWYSSNFRTIVGFDINLDNILNPNDGIYKRIGDTSYKFKNQQTIFLQKDVSDRWKKNNDKIEDKTMKDMYNCVWGLINRDEIENKEVMNKYYKLMKGQFNVVSCQFAVHYMFKNEESVDNFCKNVNDVIKSGGYFIGTCLDGNKVEAALQNNNGVVEGVIDNNIVWRIEKKYEDDYSSAYGKAVDVFMESIGKVATEFLVSLDELERKLKAFNIKKLSEKEMNTFNLKNSVDSFESLYSSSYKMHEELERYSFMNTWFVFKKYEKQ